MPLDLSGAPSSILHPPSLPLSSAAALGLKERGGTVGPPSSPSPFEGEEETRGKFSSVVPGSSHKKWEEEDGDDDDDG